MTDSKATKPTTEKESKFRVDTADPYINLINRKLRNKEKKLDKIAQTEAAIKAGDKSVDNQ